MEGVEEEARDKATDKATRDKGNKKSGASIKLIIILNLLSYCTYYLTILIIIKYASYMYVIQCRIYFIYYCLLKHKCACIP